MTSSQTSREDAVRCYRCHKTKPASQFYRRADGTIIQGCRNCHREMSAARRRSKVVGFAEGTRQLLAEGSPAPVALDYRCDGCGRHAETAAGRAPRGWRLLKVAGAPATLCTRCAGLVLAAARVAEAVASRRGSH